MRSSTVAIILGASEWPRSQSRWTSSAAFRSSATAFRDYLLAPNGLGLDGADVLDLFDDPRSAADLDDAIDQFLGRRRLDDRLKDVILYFTGHGAFAEDRRYVLATRATRVDALGQSGYRVASLARTINRSVRDGRKFVILDACFAGAAEQDFIVQSDVATHLEDQAMSALAESGTALLCATSSADVALAPSAGTYTMFSGALMKALTDGSPHPVRYLSFDDLRHLIANLIEKQYRDEAVMPEMHVPDQRRGDISRVAFFPNPRFAVAPVVSRGRAPPVEPAREEPGVGEDEGASTGESADNRAERPDAPAGHSRWEGGKRDRLLFSGLSGSLNTVRRVVGAGLLALFALLGAVVWRGNPTVEGTRNPPANPPSGAGSEVKPASSPPFDSNVTPPPPPSAASTTEPPHNARTELAQRNAECARIFQRLSLGETQPELLKRARALKCRG